MEEIKVGIYLMQKNEYDLLPLFVDYYGSLFGFESIHILDNGSNQKLRPILSNAEKKGCKMIYGFDKPVDFENKGKIIGELITNNINKFNISLPLDCDEFLVLESSGERHILKDLFYKYFYSLENGAYLVKKRYLNNPYKKDNFYQPPKAHKYFFKNCPAYIDNVGFHSIKESSLIDEVKISSLAYFEYHNRSFKELIEKSKEKMKLRINLKNIPKKYSGPGHHLHKHLLMRSENDYIESMKDFEYFKFEELGLFLNEIGHKIPFNLS